MKKFHSREEILVNHGFHEARLVCLGMPDDPDRSSRQVMTDDAAKRGIPRLVVYRGLRALFEADRDEVGRCLALLGINPLHWRTGERIPWRYFHRALRNVGLGGRRRWIEGADVENVRLWFRAAIGKEAARIFDREQIEDKTEEFPPGYQPPGIWPTGRRTSRRRHDPAIEPTVDRPQEAVLLTRDALATIKREATSRQKKILHLVLHGYKRREIARLLGITRNAVDVQLGLVKKKLPFFFRFSS